jgi:ribosomal peptide maturation radical SAM protein 1
MSSLYNISKEATPAAALNFIPTANDPIALVYMPWGSAARGSIAIGILKECAKQIGVKPDVHYLNIKFAEKIGLELYESISEASAFFPEWFFSSVLFGPQGLGLLKNSWEDLLSTELGGKMAERLKELTNGSEEVCLKIVNDYVPQYIDECLASVDWSQYRVIGFSVTFAQTLASLLLAKRIKDRHPDLKIVLGGANVDSEMGFEVIKAFDWVDYVVHGEAERSFPQLLKNIYNEDYEQKIPGVSARRGCEIIPGFSDAQLLHNLNESPMPDYSDFMKEAKRANIDKRFRIKLSFESSRGCWWGAKAHCTFCGLNGQNMAFRKKEPERVYDEVLKLAGEYRCLQLNATDNILDMGYFKQLLPRLAESNFDLSLFYEVKANLTREQVRKLAASGITQIQPGIESFDTELLRMMRKGVTAIQNIQLLKWCYEDGIDAYWNILYGFPGERPEQYKDLPRLLRLLSHLRPPSGFSPVIFERFSPYHFEKEKFKLTLTPFPLYPMLYPSPVEYDKVAYYFHGKWEGQTVDPQEYISPALEVQQEWLARWEEGKTVFYYEKGPGFLTLYDNRPLVAGAGLRFRRQNLNEKQARVYLFCDEKRSFKAIEQMLNEGSEKPLPEDKLRIMLDQFVEHGLMFAENDSYLSLAVKKSAIKSHIRASAESNA